MSQLRLQANIEGREIDDESLRLEGVEKLLWSAKGDALSLGSRAISSGT